MLMRFCQPKRGLRQSRNQLLSRCRGTAGQWRIVTAMEADKRKALLARRQALAEEIARHPRPITACDVHFNRLLEERAALSEQIDKLDELIARG